MITIGTLAEYVFLIVNIGYLVYVLVSEKKKMKLDPKYKKMVEEKSEFLIYKMIDKPKLVVDVAPAKVIVKKINKGMAKQKGRLIKKVKKAELDLGNGSSL